jgi:hypothetical protein
MEPPNKHDADPAPSRSDPCALAKAIYQHAQQLLELSSRSGDPQLASAMRALAHSLKELAYSQDDVIEIR